MVSLRCIKVVKEALNTTGIPYKQVNLGEVELLESELFESKKEALIAILSDCGLELMQEKKSTTVEKIKNCIIEMVHYSNELPRVKLSIYLSKKLNLNYTYLSNLFKEVTGMTIQHFIVLHKIEKAKELILYDELTLNEITHQLQYSSVAHLSNQFKQITGITPTHFKKAKTFKNRVFLEKIELNNLRFA
ncbi:MAG: hypothetical protein RIQ59_1244 [Bacteroidota bacterium]|jgi:AraC-like DNA-binding protein